MEVKEIIGRKGRRYTRIICKNKKDLEEVKHKDLHPLTCADIARGVVEGSTRAGGLDRVIFGNGWDTTEGVIRNPAGDYLFIHNFLDLIGTIPSIKRDETDKNRWALSLNPKEAKEIYSQIRTRPGTLEITRKQVVKNKEDYCSQVDFLADITDPTRDNLREEIIEFFIQDKYLAKAYTQCINQMQNKVLIGKAIVGGKTSRISLLEEFTQNENGLSPTIPLFFNKPKKRLTELNAVRMNGLLPLGAYFATGGNSETGEYTFLVPWAMELPIQKQKRMKLEYHVPTWEQVEVILKSERDIALAYGVLDLLEEKKYEVMKGPKK